MYANRYLAYNLVVFIVTQTTSSYFTECPDISIMQLLGNRYCKENSVYVCLEDTVKQSIMVFCRNVTKLQFTSPGQKYVWTNTYRNVYCNTSRFQPLKFVEENGHQCIFLKSTCSELGQQINNYTESDRDNWCSCNQTAGFIFLATPRNILYCIPSEEDCSCKQTTVSSYEFYQENDSTPKLISDHRNISQPSDNDQINKTYLIDFKSTQFNRHLAAILVLVVLFTAGVFLLYVICHGQQNEINEFPQILMKCEEADGIAGKSVTLYCHVVPPSNIKYIRWYLVKESEDIIIDVECNPAKYNGSTATKPDLTINNLSLDDCGRYLCEARNENCTTKSSFVTLKIKVEKPNIIIFNAKLTGTLGSSVTLKCVIDSYIKKYLIHWVFNDRKENIERKVNYDKNETKYHVGNIDIHVPFLTINNLTLDDIGEYKCVCANEAGCGVSEPIFVDIEREKPNVFTPKVKTGYFNKAVTIDSFIHLDNTTLQKLEWAFQRKNKRIVLDTSEHQTKYEGGNSKTPSLTISRPTFLDSGIYTCYATNEVGVGKSEPSNLKIRKGVKPMIFTCFDEYRIEYPNMTTIMCLVVADPKPSDVTFKVCTIDNISTTISRKLIATDFPHVYLVSLDIREPGTYVCRAENYVGCTDSISIKCDLDDHFKAVVGIDIGSTCCKCVIAVTGKEAADKCIVLERFEEPTCILMNQLTETVIAFGNEARKEYTNVLTDATPNRLYFEKFMTAVFAVGNPIENAKIESSSGDRFPVTVLLSVLISIIKHAVLKRMEDRQTRIPDKNILWVFTLASSWYKSKENTFTMCCEKAGIIEDNLLLLLESSAAYIYHARTTTMLDDVQNAQILDSTKKNYVMIDSGGSTLTTSILKELNPNKTTEICSVSLNSFIAMFVKEVLRMFEDIVGDRVMDTLSKDEIISYNDLLHEIEQLVNSFVNFSSAQVIVIPIQKLDNLCYRFLNESLQDAINISTYSKYITLKENSMCISTTVLTEMLNKILGELTSKIVKFCESKDFKDTDAVFFGGCSQSDCLQNAVKDKLFNSMKVITVNNPKYAVAEGAVFFGCIPSLVTTRISKHVFGRRIRPKYNPEKHDLRKRVGNDNDGFRCKDVFESFIHKNKFIPIGFKVCLEYFTIEKDQKHITIAIFISDREDTKYVDEEGCTQLCKYRVNVPNPSSEPRYMDLELEFGGKNLKLTAVDRITKISNVTHFPLHLL